MATLALVAGLIVATAQPAFASCREICIPQWELEWIREQQGWNAQWRASIRVPSSKCKPGTGCIIERTDPIKGLCGTVCGDPGEYACYLTKSLNHARILITVWF